MGRYISHERIVEQTKEDYYEVLKRSSDGWHESKHDVKSWFIYFLSTWRMAYREFEERAGQQKPERGSKTELVEYALNNSVRAPLVLLTWNGFAPMSAAIRYVW